MKYSKTCLNCSKIFFVAKSKNTERTKCCSRICLYEHMHTTRTSGIINYICKTCGNIFTDRVVAKRTFCSNKCCTIGNIGSTITDEHKKAISTTRKRDWENGVYDNVVPYSVKWYYHYNNKNELVSCQGHWEKQYAEWLDANNIEYTAHKGAFRYFNEVGKERVYLPDFHLIKDNLYIDIKSSYINSLAKNKLSNVLKYNNINLKFLFEIDLIEMGIVPIGISKNRMITIANRFYNNNIDFLSRIEKHSW